MGEMLLGEADALLRAITGLLPFANGAAGDVVTHLRRTLAVLVTDADAPPDHPASGVHREAPRPATLAAMVAADAAPVSKTMATPLRRSNGAMRIGETRVDPEWPAQLARLRKAMTERGATLTALAHVAGVPQSTARDYLKAGRVPPAAAKAALMAWLDTSPAQAREETAAPAAPFPGSGRPFRIGAAETAARA